MRTLDILAILAIASLIVNGALLLKLDQVTRKADQLEADAGEAWAMVQQLRSSYAQGWRSNF